MNKNCYLSIPFICLFLVFYKSSYGQKSSSIINIDSLYTALKVVPNSAEKVDNLISLYKKSIKQKEIRKDVLEEALVISEKIYYINGLAKCYNRLGITARYENDYGKSIMYHKRSLNYFDQSTDTLSKIKCLNSLGVSYRKLNLEKEAFDYYFQALKLSEVIKDQNN